MAKPSKVWCKEVAAADRPIVGTAVPSGPAPASRFLTLRNWGPEDRRRFTRVDAGPRKRGAAGAAAAGSGDGGSSPLELSEDE